ncbi:DNA oxidative demethylase AlkB [Herbaspirillum autotrophicum]|uniref:DNA oxidative demethylase AlkB n=1 Tax=Herbaspirillum autotrophicum TaxID=180195 RepID=UPI00067E04B5|nr:DNA oxidative demethylase AlkB [Herbaspirillum autotrophicum]
MTFDLFDPIDEPRRTEQIGDAAFVLRGCALPYVAALLPPLEAILQQAPFRHMMTPGGLRMGVALTNCGALGWISDRRGYRYGPMDPDSEQPWPALPDVFIRLAQDASEQAGFPGFAPDACLINRYEPGTRLTLHQDKNEKDFAAPIVSVSLGIPAVFLFGGHERSDRTERVSLVHGDVAVWGGVDRLRYHGIMPLKHADHPLLGAQRINLTFRHAG